MPRKVRTINRTWIATELLLNGSGSDTNDGTKLTPTASNVTYGTTYAWYQAQHGIFNGSSSSVTLPSTVNSVLALSFRIYPTANNKTLASYTGGSVTLTSGDALSSTGLTSPTYYVNGQNTTTITQNTWNDCVITFSSLNVASFNFWASSFAGNAQAVRLHTVTPSTFEIQSLYREWLRMLGGKSMGRLMDSLVGYWDMRGDAQEVIAGNNGTLSWASLTTWRLGNSNGAYSFADGNYIYATGIPFPSGWTADLTYAFWAKWNSAWLSWAASDWKGCIYASSWNYALGIATNSWTNTNVLRLVQNDWAFTTSADGNVSLDSNWHFYVATKESSWTVMKLYEDGVAIINSTGLTGRSVVCDRMSISGNSSSPPVNTLDKTHTYWEHLAFNKALSASEALALYNESKYRYVFPFN